MAKRPVPKYDFKAFGAAIKAARTGRKESRKKVSDEMFISPRYLANIENKGQHPRCDHHRNAGDDRRGGSGEPRGGAADRLGQLEKRRLYPGRRPLQRRGIPRQRPEP